MLLHVPRYTLTLGKSGSFGPKFEFASDRHDPRGRTKLHHQLVFNISNLPYIYLPIRIFINDIRYLALTN